MATVVCRRAASCVRERPFRRRRVGLHDRIARRENGPGHHHFFRLEVHKWLSSAGRTHDLFSVRTITETK